MNSSYIVTGGPSTGKSTLLKELEKRGYKTVPESARVLIDNALSEGKTINEVRKDETKFLYDVFDHRLNVEQSIEKAGAVFFDRGLHDILAYLRFHGSRIEDRLLTALDIFSYQKIFLLEHLNLYVEDYARTETEEESKQISKYLYDTYSEYGMRPVLVPPLPPRERADFVLRHIA